MASIAEDQSAKKFDSIPSKAKIYIYRKSKLYGSGPLQVFIGGKLCGVTAPATYVVCIVDEGQHTITSFDPYGKTVAMKIQAHAGAIYFVEQFKGFSHRLIRTSESEGKKEVLKCRRLLNQ